MNDKCYLLEQVLEKLQLTRSTFMHLRAHGQLPCVEELLPRLGRRPRFRADLIDLYVAGKWGSSKFFGGAQQNGSTRATNARRS